MSKLADKEFEFTKLHPGDEEKILTLYRTYRTNTYPPQMVRQLLADFPSVGVFHKGALIGFSYFEYFAPDIIELGNIFVHKEWRNAGLGKKIIALMEAHAAALGYKAIILTNSLGYETVEPKEHASGFYKRNGYENVLHTEQSDVFVKYLSGAQ
ncbi:GNAT family N-acetyltransferase [Hyphococcus sp. DH-69]|uniref:GNAT family N-acetyltransferase n=1 Tax=Hyphococcus formosus TaxID=3143534 RepID=UPI00398B24BA